MKVVVGWVCRKVVMARTTPILGGRLWKMTHLSLKQKLNRNNTGKLKRKTHIHQKVGNRNPIDEPQEVYSSGMEMGEPKHNNDVEGEVVKVAQITMSEKFPFLIYPYGMTKAFADNDVLFLHSSCNRGNIERKLGIAKVRSTPMGYTLWKMILA